MTYPPQGPYGQQPDPYGQQQPQYGGGYQQPQQQPQQQQPQYGGYDPNAQYGGGNAQYGAGYDPNAQYGGGYGQYGGFGGGPQQPKNKGPIIAVVAIVVLVLAGVGITGFVAPGFFLSDDKGGNTGSDAPPSTGDKKGAGADAFIAKLVAAADDKDESALEGFQCSDASDSVKGATKDIGDIDSAELKETEEKSDEKVVATLNIVVDGDDGDYEATVVKDGGDWCWQDITSNGGGTGENPTSASEEPTETSEPSGGGSIPDSAGTQFVQSFLDKLNAGDGAGAAAMSCSDSTSQADISEAATKGPQLQMDPAGTTADDSYVGADLKGTLGGEPAEGRTSAFTDDNGNWCIYTFFAY